MLYHYLKRTVLLTALIPLCIHARPVGHDSLSAVNSPDTTLQTVCCDSLNKLGCCEKEAGLADKSPVLAVSLEDYVPQLMAKDSTNNYNFRLKHIAAPVTLIGVGAILLSTPLIKGSRCVTNEILSWRGNKRRKSVDDYLQYLPVVSQYLLGCTGVKARHNLRDRTLITATSYATLALLTNVPKLLIDSKRPQFAGHNSFPSGHTATVFMGAELMRIEYGTWYGVGAYTVATCVGFMRMYNGRHWLHDVLAGAGVGILSARVGEWSCALWQKLWPHNPKLRYWSLVPTYVPHNKGSYGFALNAFF